MTQPYKIIFLEFRASDQVIEFVNTFKQIDFQKAQFVITFNTVKKEDVLPLICSGLTLFLSENEDDKAIEKRMFMILSQGRNGG